MTEVFSFAEVVSISAGFLSLFVGVFAIALSIYFAYEANVHSKEIGLAAKDIDTNVKKLEALFGGLYSDTFSMMKDTVSDMRRHLWSERPEAINEVEAQANLIAEQRVQEVVKQHQAALAEIVSQQGKTQRSMEDLKAELQQLFNKSLQQARRVEAEAREETTRSRVINTVKSLLRTGTQLNFDSLLSELQPILPLSEILNEMERLREEGLVRWKGIAGPTVEIRISPKFLSENV